MNKLLFIGNFNPVFENVNNCFKDNELFRVQLCIDNIDMVKGMLKLSQPNMIIISMIGICKDAEKILLEIKKNYSTIPVACIGSSSEISRYISHMNTTQFTSIVRPVTNEEIINTICEILEIESEKECVENNINSKKSILLVDDSGMQLRALNELLKEHYEVRMATSGMQALTLIGKKVPDVIFLDYEMPVCDGKLTLEMIRGLDEGKDIPVVFLTGVNDKEHIEAVMSLKPAGYLLKPAKAERIFEILGRIL